MPSLHHHRGTVAVFAGLSLAGALAGCSATDGSNAAEIDPSSGDIAYTDGTYTESGNYQSPNGTETVDVTVVLADDIVTAVVVVGHGESHDSQRYQGEFIRGIAAEVVGKDIDSLAVSKVAGSSLTSGGFNAAIDAIKADAAS
ncbi:hypothetical protein QMG83_03295 [Salinibacterium sp. G-O1]|uniref:FMN-binding protein n=1 Tax=Salinibacterium sp. G-O1 TaxID=3046208 RepID=UPI0024B8A76A|nr:hypothetical protein [Salinibacterium sp. G-O1]MDJ0334245.1 hypothetical protein [Salinibacterium sp. G-O1]